MVVERRGANSSNSDNGRTQTPREFAEAYEARRRSPQTRQEFADVQSGYSQHRVVSDPLVRMTPFD